VSDLRLETGHVALHGPQHRLPELVLLLRPAAPRLDGHVAGQVDDVLTVRRDGYFFECARLARRDRCAPMSLWATTVFIGHDGSYLLFSRGRGNVRLLRCKSFEERWGRLAQGRLLGLAPSGFTRLGAAVRHGTHLVETQAGTQRRLLIVVGDGIAYDDGYEGQYAVADSRRAIDEAAARAVGCVGLSTRPITDGTSVWPPQTHRIAATTRELAPVARDLLGGALLRAGRPSTGPTMRRP